MKWFLGVLVLGLLLTFIAPAKANPISVIEGIAFGVSIIKDGTEKIKDAVSKKREKKARKKELINIYTNNLNELHKKICVNTQISLKAVFVDMCRVRFNYVFLLFL